MERCFYDRRKIVYCGDAAGTLHSGNRNHHPRLPCSFLYGVRHSCSESSADIRTKLRHGWAKEADKQSIRFPVVGWDFSGLWHIYRLLFFAYHITFFSVRTAPRNGILGWEYRPGKLVEQVRDYGRPRTATDGCGQVGRIPKRWRLGKKFRGRQKECDGGAAVGIFPGGQPLDL